jgi:hypothetical protein
MISTYSDAVLRLAVHFGKELSDTKVLNDADFVKQQLSLEDFLKAIALYCRDSNNKFYPNNIQQVIDMVKKPVKNEDIAANIASEILKAVSNHGYTWARGSWGPCIIDGVTRVERFFKGKDISYLQWEHAALSVFGPVGITIVRKYGGWESFCNTVNESQDGVVRAQITKLASSLLNTQDRTGSFDIPLISGESSPLLGTIIQLAERKQIKE